MLITIFLLCALLSVCFSLHECDAGFYGTNCSIPCRHPNYGLDCQSLCNCEEQLCNATYGCLYNFTAISDDEYIKPTMPLEENKTKETHSQFNLILITIITLSGFLLAIISIIVVYLANKKYLSRRILKTEKYIDTVITDLPASRWRDTPRDNANSEGRRTSRYEQLSLNLSTDLQI